LDALTLSEVAMLSSPLEKALARERSVSDRLSRRSALVFVVALSLLLWSGIATIVIRLI
jgi:hypothetical protein